MPTIQTVENPILNSPFEEPQHYWLIREGQAPERRDGRRLASYFLRVPERAARGFPRDADPDLFQDDVKGEEYTLDNANLIRARIKEWRISNYAGATAITKELLELWRSEHRREPLFYAQLEAAETILLLAEARADLLQGIKVLMDEPGPNAREQGYRAFQRYALKMATGSGKTTVMGMLAAWSILNKVNDPQAAKYSDTILIVCPNVTIRDRLQELDPALGDISLYRKRELVPTQRMPELRKGEVLVLNWHHLERRELSDVNGVSARVVKRGVPVTTVKKSKDDAGNPVTLEETKYYESDAKFLERILGRRRGRSGSILVFNDEAHHAYRRGDVPNEISLERETAKKDAREATVWIEGLDRINKLLGGRGNGIRYCVDLSATPFYIQGSGNEVGKPFPWVVSDFGLLESIEAGLVKIPQLPVQDTTGSAIPPYFNIWRWVAETLRARDEEVQLAPETVLKHAAAPITQLAQDWAKVAELWREDTAEGRRPDVPPVFIVVCRDTKLAKIVYDWLANADPAYGPAPEWFRNAPGREVTIRVDSKVAEEIEEGSGSDEIRRLRFVLETIGKTAWPGGRVPEDYSLLVQKNNHRALEEDSELSWIDETIPPGRNIRCIISVAMLTEGWDATTVTHIVGLRPFGSQLLCEQVVGRALRRTRYAVGEDGKFVEETAKVFGVPFEIIPFKVQAKEAIVTPPIYHIQALPEKAEFEISFPIVTGYQRVGVVDAHFDRDRAPSLVLDPMVVPDVVLLRNLSADRGRLAQYAPGEKVTLSLEAWRRSVRPQQVAFMLAAQLLRQWRTDHGETVPPQVMFPRLLELARWYLDHRIECRGRRQKQDVAINPYFQDALNHLWAAISVVDADGTSLELPEIPSGAAGTRSTVSVDFYTGREPRAAEKCHLNGLIADTSKWEQAAAFELDQSPRVRAWVKNERLGLQIKYRKDSGTRNYIPDFIVRMEDGSLLVAEIKGQVTNDDKLKEAAAKRWVDAVNRDGRFGRWEYRVFYQPPELGKWLVS